MSNLYRGPSIDASYQVSVHLAEGFQWRLKCEKLTDDRCQKLTLTLARRAKKSGAPILHVRASLETGRGILTFNLYK